MRLPRFGLFLLWTALAGSAAAESTKVLRAELSAGPVGFTIENLAGTMRVVPGTGERIVVEATVHAESSELANAFRLDHDEAGATLRVRYPLAEVSTIRYPDRRRRQEWWDKFGFGDVTTCDYGGRSVRVSRRHGTLLYADVEIRVPRTQLQATFRNWVGRLDAELADGRLAFEVRSADLRLDRLSGVVRVSGTSGDVEASLIKGSWDSKFTSGDCKVEGFQGESFAFDTTSGDLLARGVDAARFSSRSTSGDIRVSDASLKDFSAEATSGDISLSERGAGLERLHVSTTSGDVRLKLPRDASFEANLHHGSGDVRVDFSEAFAQSSGSRTVRYRRGNGGVQIDASTGSGDLTISPAQ